MNDETKTGANNEVASIELLCPLCGFNAGHQNQIVAASKLDLHIRLGHTTDEINSAVDDGRVSESGGKFGVGHNKSISRNDN